jgi:hypothetical protein
MDLIKFKMLKIRLIKIAIFSSLILSIFSCRSRLPLVFSDSEFYRADAIAQSSQLQISKEKALFMAKARLSQMIGSQINLTEHKSEKQEQTQTHEWTDVELSNIQITTEKSKKLRNGQFETYIAIELRKADK